MKKPDTDKYVSAGNSDHTAAATAKSFGKIVLKGLLTLLTICMVTGIIVAVAMFSFIMSMKDEKVDFDLTNLKLNYTSFIFVNGEGDDASKPVELTSLYKDENRVWVDYDGIPEAMKNAIVAIEDKRFWDHKGVDWIRTAGAVVNLMQNDSYGGSTITQQLVKNITNYDEVSLTRKVKEIFRALNLEKTYTKQQILEAYLNYVSFGSGTQGVQAAAKLYFGKDIKDCTIAECASIAGITQNPSKYSPLIYPENNKERQQTVLDEMHKQEFITDEEFAQAMEDSNNMNFVGQEATEDNNQIWNWYTEALINDVIDMLMEKNNINRETASDRLYHGGYKIYSAENREFQNLVQNYVLDPDLFYGDTQMQLGYYAMDYSGRVLATAGSRNEKVGNMVQSFATDTRRQSGSSIKPIAVYAPAIDNGAEFDGVPATYSTLVNDKPIENYFGNGTAGPNNWNNVFHSWVPIYEALYNSYNASSAQLCKAMGPAMSYNFLLNQLHFTSLEEADNNLSAMAVGGQNTGVTVKEMTAGFQVFGNGGQYFKPYTYYYVEDHDGNVIQDNRTEPAEQAIKSTTAGIMNRMLQNVITRGTGTNAAISGWQIFGKTGTSDVGESNTPNSWFVGGSPYLVAGIWTGYEQQRNIPDTQQAVYIWRDLMRMYLESKPNAEFNLDSNIVARPFCRSSGLLAGNGCGSIETGYYDANNLPRYCNGGSNHKAWSGTTSKANSEAPSSAASSEVSSQASSETPSSSSEAPPPSSATPPPSSETPPPSSATPPPSSATPPPSNPVETSSTGGDNGAGTSGGAVPPAA